MTKHSAYALFFAAVLAVSPAFAASVATVPVGYFTVNIAGGTEAVPATTRFSVPLVDTPQAQGASGGPLSGLTSTSMTVADADWIDGALSTVQYPYAVRILSGARAGLTLKITANTTDTLTVAGVDLVALGVLAGDRVQLIPVDTLSTLFGASTLTGATSAAAADVVYLGANLLFGYYYNTTLGRWVSVSGPTIDRGNLAIMPDQVIHVVKKSAAVSLTFTGRVPEAAFVTQVANTGNTYTHSGFPADTTLAGLALQNRVSGWVTAEAAGAADQVWLPLGGTWISYYHNGVQWQSATGPKINRDSVPVAAGTPILIAKQGITAGSAHFLNPLPYTLD